MQQYEKYSTFETGGTRKQTIFYPSIVLNDSKHFRIISATERDVNAGVRVRNPCRFSHTCAHESPVDFRSLVLSRSVIDRVFLFYAFFPSLLLHHLFIYFHPPSPPPNTSSMASVAVNHKHWNAVSSVRKYTHHRNLQQYIGFVEGTMSPVTLQHAVSAQFLMEENKSYNYVTREARLVKG